MVLVHEKSPDDYVLLQCPLCLDVVNDILCTGNMFTRTEINIWKREFFKFGERTSNIFNVDVSTKLHSLMRHVYCNLLNLGCKHRGSSKENEMHRKQFKPPYNNTNEHLNSIAPQLIITWIRNHHETQEFCLHRGSSE